MKNKLLLGLMALGATALTVGFLAGYPAQADDDKVVDGKAGGTAAGILETSAGRYEFTPATCAIYKDGDSHDIEIGGQGVAPDGEDFYFEFSSTANAISIGLGVDGPFASSDRVLRAGRSASQEFEVVVAGEKITVPALVLVDENFDVIDETASLSIDCEG